MQRGYVKKYAYSLAVFALFLSGCNDTVTQVIESSDLTLESNESTESNAITENQLLNSSFLDHVTENNILVLSLETQSLESVANDLDESGKDCYNFTMTQDMPSTLLKIDPDTVIASVSIEDLQTQEITEAFRDSAAVFVQLKKDRTYRYCLVHDYISDKTQTLFSYFTTTTAPLDWTQDDVDTLLSTNKCVGCNLIDVDLTEAQLSESNLSRAKMNNAILYRADLSHADLSGTVLLNVNLEKANLDDTNLSGNVFSYTHINGASFRGTVFPDNFDFTKNPTVAQADPLFYKYVDFSGAQLQNAIMVGVDFTGATFSYADLSGANICDAKFVGDYFVGTNLSHLKKICEADLTNANLDGVYPLDAIRELYLSSANLSGARFNLFNFKDDNGEPSELNYCAPALDRSSSSKAALCTQNVYGDLGLLLLTWDEYNEQRPDEQGYVCSESVGFFTPPSFEYTQTGIICLYSSSGVSDIKNSYDNSEVFTQTTGNWTYSSSHIDYKYTFVEPYLHFTFK